MANLRDRLKRIQELKKNEKPRVKEQETDDYSILTENGWETCGYKVLRREISVNAPFNTRAELPQPLAILVPDLAGRSLPAPEDFLFFDLETTGLSGGAGTLAFLAAFGRAVSGGKFHVTQYLLLDYPGENDFLEAALKEFENERSVIVSYNGKCFDSQILKTRCLMNRIKPPVYRHADLLHPARRLWKNVINDCSQASIETRILGIDRSGDTPGSLAPEIWFEFLRTGETERLISICDHNCADITGLSSILAAMISIAFDPVDCEIHYDLERLALYWRGFLRTTEQLKSGAQFDNLRITGDRLLRLAADKNYPYAAFVYAVDQMRKSNFEEGRKRLLKIANGEFPQNVKSQALRALAIDSERRLKSIEEALEYVNMGLELEEAGVFRRSEFEKRKERLEEKLKS
ncbi:MAG: ribonuclease H-like domain-containing protein [Treponema sp.]|nr:ribonuclease H-like domain-containing protein [Treponema sp.]